MVDQRSLAAKRNADEVIRQALIDDLDRMWDQIKGWDRLAVENAVVEIVPGLVDKYGAAYAEVAAQWFEALTGEAAVLADGRSRAHVERSIDWALRPYREVGAVDVAQERLAGSMVRHAAQVGRDTLDGSVRAAPGVLYARRLSGPSNCDFCVVLASRGPVYGTARDAGQGNRYHDRCDCVAVPVRGSWVPDSESPMGALWVGDDPGYDFESLYVEEYKPYWRPGASMDDVVNARMKARLEPANVLKAPKTSYSALIENLSLEEIPVSRLSKAFSEVEIIERLSGGDETDGSCMSVAYAYAANKADLDVLDYRGGVSQRFFSRVGNANNLVRDRRVPGWIESRRNGYAATTKVLAHMEDGREYVLATGTHAAIVRLGATGTAEYLELQSAIENGWKPLTRSALGRRFSVQASKSLSGIKVDLQASLIDLEDLTASDEFLGLLPYLNTSKSAQIKGASGGEK